MIIAQLAILIYSVILHEIAHGWMAERLGDPTARLSRRLTLNPLPHIDPFYTLLLPAILILSGAGIVFGAAKPVPIDPFNFRNAKQDTAIVSLAGPATNILIALSFSLAYRLLPWDIFLTGIQLNIGLAVFNLLPLPPLDGFKVLAGIMSDDIAELMYKLESYGLTFIFILFFFFPQIISALARPLIKLLSTLLLP
jgi:Zn-dependent protease